MENVLLYLVYGTDDAYWMEAKFSILSALRFLGSNGEKTRIVMCTDQPDKIAGFPVTIHAFNREKLAAWAGPSGYFHRSKNCCMAEVMDRFKLPTAFIDSDTYFLKSPHLLFERVGPGRTLLHKPEGLIRETQVALWQYVKDLSLEDPDGGSFSFDENSEMGNSGVVGLDPADRRLLDRALWLVDALYAPTQIFNVEQYGLTEIFRRESSMGYCGDIVAHYWGYSRAFFHHRLKTFFEKSRGAPLEQLIAESRGYEAAIPKNPFTERLRIRLKQKFRGWSPAFGAACLAALWASKSHLPEEVRSIWRNQALGLLKEELVRLEEEWRRGLQKPAELKKKLHTWFRCAELRFVFSEDHLGRFPQEEEHRWREFWHDRNVLLEKLN